MLNAAFDLDVGERLYLFFLSIGLLFALIAVFRAVYFFGPTALALRPVVPFSVFFSLVHFLTPAIKLIEHRFRYQDGYSTQTYIFSSLLMILVYLFCVMLLSSRQFSSSPKRQMASRRRGSSSKFDFYLSMLIFLTGLFFAIQDLLIIYNEIGILNFHADVHSFNSERSRYRLLANLMTLGAALYLGHKLSVNGLNGRSIFLLSCMAIPVAGYAVTLSSRNTFFVFGMVFITVMLGFSRAQITRKRLKHLSLIISKRSVRLAFGIVTTIGLVFFVSAQITDQRYSRFDSDYMSERRENALYYALEGGFGNDENILWLIENEEYPLIWGYSYFSGFVSLIPRSIWPGKPAGSGPILTNIIWPGRYVQGAEGNNSVTTGMATEALMNFGVVGFFIVPVVWAFFVSRSMRMFHSSETIYYRIAWLIISLLLSTSFVYQEFMGLFARGAIIVAPLIFIGVVYNIFRPNRLSGEMLGEKALRHLHSQ